MLAEDVGLLPGEVAGLAVLAAPAAAVPFDSGFRAAPAAPVGLAVVGALVVVPAAVDLAVVVDEDDAGLDVAPAVRVAGGFEAAAELGRSITFKTPQFRASDYKYI